MHLAKSMRNNLLNGDFSFDNNKNKIISFENVIKVYDIDKKKDQCRALTKLTETHVRPTCFQKMNVQLALQVFSHSVASTIRTSFSTGEELQSHTALPTAEFIDLLDKVCDALI